MTENPPASNRDKLRLNMDDNEQLSKPIDPGVQVSSVSTARPRVDATGVVKPPAYPGYGLAQADEAHLVNSLRVLHKRRWTALTAFIVVLGSVTIYSFTATPVYTARVQILIENENPNVVKFEEVYEQNKSTVDYYQTQYRILQSRLLAKRTLEAEHLWDHALFAQTSGGLFSTDSLGGFVKWFKRDAEKEASGANETASQSRAV